MIASTQSTGLTGTVGTFSVIGTETTGDLEFFLGERVLERRRLTTIGDRDRLRFLATGDLTLFLCGDFDLDLLPGDRDLRRGYFR